MASVAGPQLLIPCFSHFGGSRLIDSGGVARGIGVDVGGWVAGWLGGWVEVEAGMSNAGATDAAGGGGFPGGAGGGGGFMGGGGFGCGQRVPDGRREVQQKASQLVGLPFD